MSTWHYLAVFVERDESTEYSVCEVYLDDDGCIESWTESSSIAASGEGADELRADLSHMLNDIARWSLCGSRILRSGCGSDPQARTLAR